MNFDFSISTQPWRGLPAPAHKEKAPALPGLFREEGGFDQ
jgi:hypothetical protein